MFPPRRRFLRDGFLSAPPEGFVPDWAHTLATPELQAFTRTPSASHTDKPGTPRNESVFFEELEKLHRIATTTVGRRLSAIEVHTEPGQGPPLHIHLEQHEWLYLLEGTLGLQCGSQRTILHPGDSFMAPRGLPHAFVVLGRTPARHLNIYDPSGEREAFPSSRPHPTPGDSSEAAPAHERQYRIHVVGPPLKPTSFAD